MYWIYIYVSGKPNSVLYYHNAVISLKYEGGLPCHNNKFNRSTTVNFLCDETSDGSAGPKYVDESSDCTYVFDWQTSLACSPVKVGGCSVQDGATGNVYDLSRLGLKNDNHDFIDTVHHQKYIINVCRSLVHQKGNQIFIYYMFRLDPTRYDCLYSWFHDGCVTTAGEIYSS